MAESKSKNGQNLASKLNAEHRAEGKTPKQAYVATKKDLERINSQNQLKKQMDKLEKTEKKNMDAFKKTKFYDIVSNQGVKYTWSSEPVKWDSSFGNLAHSSDGYNVSKVNNKVEGSPRINIDIIPKSGVKLTEKDLVNYIDEISNDKNFDVIEGSKNFEKLSVLDDLGAKSIQAEYMYNNKIADEKATVMVDVSLDKPNKVKNDRITYANILLDAQEDMKALAFVLKRELSIDEKEVGQNKSVKKNLDNNKQKTTATKNTRAKATTRTRTTSRSKSTTKTASKKKDEQSL